MSASELVSALHSTLRSRRHQYSATFRESLTGKPYEREKSNQGSASGGCIGGRHGCSLRSSRASKSARLHAGESLIAFSHPRLLVPTSSDFYGHDIRDADVLSSGESVDIFSTQMLKEPVPHRPAAAGTGA